MLSHIRQSLISCRVLFFFFCVCVNKLPHFSTLYQVFNLHTLKRHLFKSYGHLLFNVPADVTGQQGIITPPTHHIPSLLFLVSLFRCL
jgi:hypothetical protein